MSDFPKDKIAALIKKLHDLEGSGVADRHQPPLMAEIHSLIAEEQAKSADKLEQQTARLGEETIELRRLTRGLYFFTIAVAGFAVIQIIIMLLEYCSKLHGSP